MITSVSVAGDGDILVCRNDRGCDIRFHAIWLRDNAPDPATRSPQNGQRMISITDIPPDLTIRAAGLADGQVTIRFSDREEDVAFAPDWLAAHSYDHAPAPGGFRLASDVETWDQGLGTAIPAASLDALQTSPDTLRGWLQGLNRYGVARVTDGPVESGALLDVAALFGYVRETNYGKWFEVRTEVNPVNLAYTGMALQAHTDNPYRDPVPTMQILYCLENSASGGDSIVVDGFACARRLHAESPEDFRLLSRYCAAFSYEGSSGVALHARKPMLECTPDGELTGVRFNNRSAAAFTDVPFDEMKSYYRAYRRFGELVDDPQMQVAFKLQPGESFIVDNTRVLHARTGYSGEGSRWLQGCYPDKDGMKSTLAAMVGEERAS